MTEPTPPFGLTTVSPNGAGHRDAEFSRYFQSRAESMRLTAYLLCGDWHRAEDVTQAAFLKLYLVWHRLAGHDKLDGYLRRIIVRTFLSERRRAWWKRESLTDVVPELPAQSTMDTGERLLVERALAEVPPKQRAVLVLRYWNDLSVEQTAAVLNCSTGNVKSQAARGLAKLREQLGGSVRTCVLPTEGV